MSDKEWLGMRIERPGPVLFYTGEESEKNTHGRLAPILASYQLDYASIAKRFFLHCRPVEDPVLAAVNYKTGILVPTHTFFQLHASVLMIKPSLVVIEAAGDVYSGNENDRTMVGNFIRLLRGLAMDCETAVMLLQDPSVAGMASGRGFSGVTQWNNGPRSRLYLTTVKAHEKAEPSRDLRKLEVMKSNFGPAGKVINLRWRAGVFEVVPGEVTVEKLAANSEVDDLFLKLLRQRNEQGRYVVATTGKSYAPAEFAKMSEAVEAAVGSPSFKAAMERLFNARRLRVMRVRHPIRVSGLSRFRSLRPTLRPPFDRPSQNSPSTPVRPPTAL
jgi:RecA-family ATPase